MKLVIDLGHGGPDSGTVDPVTGCPEKYANFITALTLKHFLTLDGHAVELTRTTDVDVDNAERVKARGGDVFISVHYDYPDGGPLIYYPGVEDKPQNFALAHYMAGQLGIEARSSVTSRFGRLYIDGYEEGLALLWEVDQLMDFKPDVDYRVGKVEAFRQALYSGLELVTVGDTAA